MFRRFYGSFFRFAQQASTGFTKGPATQNRRRWLGGLLGAQLGAATVVGLSDAELKKKPEWYQEAVQSLETAVKKTSKRGYIESNSVLDKSRDILQRFTDLNNTEILWRLARVLVEKADLSAVYEEKQLLLREALEVGTKALAFATKPCAAAHKWYAIALSRLSLYDKDLRKDIEQVKANLEKAVELDAVDPYAWALLGVENFKNKQYENAIRCFKKAEEVSPDFSAANHYRLAETYMKLKEKKTALEEFKKIFKLPTKYREDLKAKVDARKKLTDMKISRDEFDPIVEDL